MTSVAVIVPVLNEAARLPALLESLRAQDFAEIIVVDGGSKDDSAGIVARAARDRIKSVASERGRAQQMNAGAALACSDVLLFLHADTLLPASGSRLIGRALAAGARWGRFDVSIVPPSPLLYLVQTMMNWRSAFAGICTGDQAIFVRRDVFLAQGGYAVLPLMEDIELSRRLKRVSRPWRIRVPVLTSARRWQQHGTARTIVEMWRLRALFWLGVPASRLAARYTDVR